MVEWLTNIGWTDFLLTVATILFKLILIWIIYLIVKEIGRKLIRNSFHKMKEGNKISKGRAHTLEKLSINIFQYILLFIVIVIIFDIFHFNVAGLIAGAGVVGLAIGFGAQGLVSDVVTGFFLLIEKWFDVEDYVSVGEYSGIVEEVGLRTTQIRGFDGTLHYIPNREINSMSNHSRGNMQALVDIGISYKDNLDKAIEVIQEVCDTIAKEDKTVVEGPNVIGVQNFDSSEVTLRVIAKTENMMQWALERKLRKTIKEAFDEKGIKIPYPHQVNIVEKKDE